MLKHIQTIYGLLPMNCLSVSAYFVGLPLKGLKYVILQNVVGQLVPDPFLKY